MLFDEHHSDPPDKAALKNEVKLYSNLTNPCFALAKDHRSFPFLVPWTEMEWSFKLWMCGNCYYTPRILFPKWKIKYWCKLRRTPIIIAPNASSHSTFCASNWKAVSCEAQKR